MTALGPAPGWRDARRVLLVRLDQLGDVLMTTPAIAAVRQSLPKAHLALLGAPSTEALWPHLDGLNEFIALPAPWMKQGAAAAPADARDDPCWPLLQRLRAARFDAAIIFTVCTQSALPAATLCRLAGIPRVLAHSRERAYALLSDAVPERDTLPTPAGQPLRHEVQRQLDLVAHVGLATSDTRLRWRVREADRVAAQALLRAAGLDAGRPYVLLHPGASAPSRRYPPERLGEAAALMRSDPALAGLALVACAGPGEAALLAALQPGLGPAGVVLPVLPSVGVLGALIAQAQVLVANNSAPAHLAAAVGTPVVCLYALTNPQHTPWQVAAEVLNHDVPCRDCLQSRCATAEHACLTRVTPPQIVAAVRRLQPAHAAAA